LNVNSTTTPITSDNITADGSGNIHLAAAVGNVNLDSTLTQVSSATGTITITGVGVNTHANITTGATSGAGISITTTDYIKQWEGDISTTGASGIVINAAGNFIQSGGAIINSGTYTTVSAGGNITVDPITAGTFIDLRADNDITITGNLTANGTSGTVVDNSIYLRADDDNSGTGGITFSGTTASPVIISTLHGVVLALAYNIYSLGDVTFNIGGDMSSGDGRVVSTDGTTGLDFSLAFIASNDVGPSGSPLLLTANLPNGSFVTIADGYLNLIDTSANDFSHDPDVVTGGHLAFHNGATPNGAGSVTISSDSIVNSGQDITIIAPDAIDLHNSTYTAPGNILVHSKGSSVTVDSGTSTDHTTLTAGGDITITADAGGVSIR